MFYSTQDNYNRMCQETKPKKPRRKIKPSAMIRPQKRNKKRKRSTTQKVQEVLSSALQNDTSIPSSNHVVTEVGAGWYHCFNNFYIYCYIVRLHIIQIELIVRKINTPNGLLLELNVCETSSAYESSEDVAIGGLSETEFVTIKTEDHIGKFKICRSIYVVLICFDYVVVYDIECMII